jgi:MFS family permease
MFGGGVGMSWPHLASLLIALSPEAEREGAGAFVTLLQIGAAAFGAALAGMIANITGLPKVTTHMDIMIAAFGLFATFAAAPLLATFTANRVLSREKP